MTKMATMPIYGNTLKNLLLWNQKLWNQKADDLECWYVALGAQLLPSMFKWWSWVDIDLFYNMVKFGPLCFCMGKVKTMDFSETVVVLWYESWYW